MLAVLTNKFEAVLQNQLGDIAVAQQGFRVQLQQFFLLMSRGASRLLLIT